MLRLVALVCTADAAMVELVRVLVLVLIAVPALAVAIAAVVIATGI
jgi:hypothetical protein